MSRQIEKLLGIVLILGLLFIGQPVRPIHAYEEITSNTTWSGYVYPTEDVVVRSGSTLTVEPGATVLFQCHDDGNYPGSTDSDRISIIVESGGTLEADGVDFVGVGYPGDDCWRGIEFESGSSGYIRNSTIRDGVRGVYMESEVEISGNTIEYMKGRDGYEEFHASGGAAYGIYVDSDGLSPVIEDNMIQRIYGGNGWYGPAGSDSGKGGPAYGIAVLDGSPIISGNTFQMIYGGDGADGSPGANGVNGDNATTLGADGEAGTAGGDGEDGASGGIGAGIWLSTDADLVVITENTIKVVRSGSSGDGGDGGDGGNGGDGAPGLTDTHGQNGGNGGLGGNGGNGGNGFHSAYTYGIYSRATSVQIIGNALSNIHNGSGGQAGDGGDGGVGGAGGMGGEGTANVGGNGGLGAAGGSGGLPGSVSGVNSCHYIFIQNSTLAAFSANILSGGTVISSGPGANGGSGGAGGDGGDAGSGILADGNGGEGGAGGNGTNGGTPATAGNIYGMWLYNLSTVTEPITNNIFNEMTAHEAEPGGNGGNGGDGGDGGLGMINGNGGDGGDGGNGGNGGSSGFAAFISIQNSSMDFVNNTFFKPTSPLAGDNGGLAGVEGTGGSGNDPGTSGTTGSPGVSGSSAYAVGLYAWENTDLTLYTINIYNSIFATSSVGHSTAIQKPASAEMTVISDYNDIWNWETDYTGVTPGGNDIDTNPLFVHTATYDFHLTESSGCIDTGNNGAPGAPDIDFDGNERPIDGDNDTISTIDMGAFEFIAEWQIFLPLIMK